MSQQQHYYDESYPGQNGPYYGEHGYGNSGFNNGSYASGVYDEQGEYYAPEYGQEYYDEYDSGGVMYDGQGREMYNGGEDGYYRQEDRYYDYPQDAYIADTYDPYGVPMADQRPLQYFEGQDEYHMYDRKGKRRGSSEGSETFSDFTMRSDMARAAEFDSYGRFDERYRSYGPSTESLNQMASRQRGYRPDSQISYTGNRSSGASTPIYGMYYNQAAMMTSARSREPYPAWTAENQIPVSKEEIEDIFIDLTNKFGFQRDSMRNMYDHMMVLLDSRASRMTPNQALLSLHADYIGGDNANYRNWYFAAQFDLDDAVGFSNMDLGKNRKSSYSQKSSKKFQKNSASKNILQALDGDNSLESAIYRWKTRCTQMSQYDRARELALYLLCWGEANQVRFTPECLCFIFKCANDYLNSPQCQAMVEPAPEGSYLNDVITPLYTYMRDQGYEIINGRYVRRERDHNKIIGYDDINQLFWYPEGIERIVLSDKTRMVDLPLDQRYPRFKDVVWKKAFFKTYRETRSWFHLFTNFNRIWIIHITVYWFYTAANSPTVYTHNYQQSLDNQPPFAYRMSAVGFGGGVASLLMIIATLAEWAYVPRRWPGAQHLTRRLLFLILFLIINVAPGVYVIKFAQWKPNVSVVTTLISIMHFLIAIFTFLFFAIMPLGGLFGNYLYKKTRRYVASQTFTANFAKLKGNDLWLSYGLWIAVFACKFAESYFFLSLSLRDPIRYLNTMTIGHCGIRYLGSALCPYQAKITLGIMYITDLVLFFLDTYLWYIIWNTICSVARSFYLGVSIWTPWRNIFSRMPKRIYSKILATNDMEIKYKPKVLISQVWNAVVISMYREHLLAIDHVQKLLYHQVPSEQEGKRTLRAPTFFISQEDHSFKTEFFPSHSEAERRISFFAQSLSTPIPEPLPVDNMPTFTVLVPHYGEKILYSLREIIREDDQLSRVTLLEYLKQLHPVEWDCFVKDTKILAEETSLYNGGVPFDKDEKDTVKSKIDDLPFYCVGFKSSAPEYTLRTRIWASLRSQTLYRTVSGFMNYSRAIKLLYRVENPDVVQMFGGNTDKLEHELERMARRKFKFVISMQRFFKFSKEELENTEFLLRAYPDLQIAYLDEEPPMNEGDEPKIYSSLIDGYSEIMENGKRRPKFRIQLSGNPILGDGKSDNQNHAIIFYRGEYIQLIDANQDNYLEECLKIRSVLAEFEEMTPIEESPYNPNEVSSAANPVAILGAREYIFSENIGVLGDVAAGKEQTFGTLFARTLAQIGGKLHYGHPDFLNGPFMTTRGGVSKAQKGLHLNEDIYAGMTALLRGGRIKHCEYYQCGKGRDLGFGSILNFTTKVGTGMGEQMLSREYYYLGTQLPLDRFLSFYYAHPGFHINNLFIILSVQLLMIVMINLGSMYNILLICRPRRGQPITDPYLPVGCYSLAPVLDWIKRSIISIFIVFFIAFIPLVVQELTERGVWRASTRLAKHFGSLSPLFEVFVSQIYANSLLQNLAFGGARYIGTGRGFATTRIPFSILFSRFAGASIYLGSRTLIMLLFATVTMWIPHLVYFWVSVLALCISPFIFNPHQFSWTDFFVDYREFIRWLSRGNSRSHANSWIGYCRLSRTRITGFKRKALGQPSEKLSGDIPRAGFSNVFFSEVIGPMILVLLSLVPYCFINSRPGFEPFGKSNPAKNGSNPLIRIAIVSFAPICVNAMVAFVFFGMACCMGPILTICCKKFGAVLATISHAIAVIILVTFFEVLWFLEGWSFSKTILGLVTMISLQRAFLKMLTIMILTREFKHDGSNLAWWTGRWYSNNLGVYAMSQPAREFVCKVIELSLFAADFCLGHLLLFILTPILAIPYIDRWHSMLLFWLRPSRQIRPPIFSLKQNKLRKRIVRRYATLFFGLFLLFLMIILVPALGHSKFPKSLNNIAFLKNLGLIQPSNDPRGATGRTTRPGNSNGTYKLFIY
ncbi:hypothetical protein PNEG_03180 [Pneumocystis murina B123]|uniref:1,3-beta-glucan synthase n=1 Tax=Pneumocystis murina (strain B123) TaxID=1069680 RepID=M7P3D9_PNEMU|nr:hypothetical protein PNEG_03180 [Pneumocystis murina B123]EMR08340.1 hypothetical protein PNEG_03180 [Pneumocystis murina B123]